MNKRDDTLVVQFDKDKIRLLKDWKEFYCFVEGGSIKKKIVELIEEDYKKNKIAEEVLKIRKLKDSIGNKK